MFQIFSSLFTSLISLEKLYMQFNKITTIDSFAFRSLGIVKEMYFSNNNLTDLLLVNTEFGPLSVFNYCRHLTRLDLSHNKITWIYSDWNVTPPGTFEYLNLAHNNITAIWVCYFIFVYFYIELLKPNLKHNTRVISKIQNPLNPNFYQSNG